MNTSHRAFSAISLRRKDSGDGNSGDAAVSSYHKCEDMNMKLFDVAATRDILALFLPSSLQMLTDWTRPLIFNLFVSRSIANSMLPPEEATLEEDAVGLAVMSLNLIMFATAYGFNGAIDSYASVAFGSGNRAELFAVLARQGVLLCGLCVPALLLLANAEHILLRVLQPSLAERTARLLQLMGWAIPGDFACAPRLLHSPNPDQPSPACAAKAMHGDSSTQRPLHALP